MLSYQSGHIDMPCFVPVWELRNEKEKEIGRSIYGGGEIFKS